MVLYQSQLGKHLFLMGVSLLVNKILGLPRSKAGKDNEGVLVGKESPVLGVEVDLERIDQKMNFKLNF
jgi:hypothetical protein